jgi:hypothetical protein
LVDAPPERQGSSPERQGAANMQADLGDSTTAHMPWLDAHDFAPVA